MNFEHVGISPCLITHKVDKKFKEIPIYLSGRDRRHEVEHVIDNVEVNNDDEIIERMCSAH